MPKDFKEYLKTFFQPAIDTLSVPGNTRPIKHRVWLCTVVFFVYGSLVHFGLIKIYVGWSYTSPASRAFVDYPLVQPVLVLLAGASVAYFMRSLLRYFTLAQVSNRKEVILRSALAANLATIVAFQGFYILVALYRAATQSTLGITGFSVDLSAEFLAIQGYGYIPIIIGIPFQWAYGVLAGLVILRARRLIPFWPYDWTRARGMARTSLTLSFLGLALIWTVTLGGLLSCLGLIFGFRSKRACPVGRNIPAEMGMFLGVFGVVILIFALLC